jgi:hypothetical protein
MKINKMDKIKANERKNIVLRGESVRVKLPPTISSKYDSEKTHPCHVIGSPQP